MMSAVRGHTGVVAVLLNGKSDPSLRNADGLNAAMCAASQGHYDVLRVLLMHPGQVSLSIRSDTAADAHSILIPTHTLTHDHEIYKNPMLSPDPPPHPTQPNPHPQSLDGELVRSKDRRGRTCLHFAAERGAVPCVELLLKNGADVFAKTAAGKTALDEATRSGNAAVMDVLKRAVDESEARARAAAAALLASDSSSSQSQSQSQTAAAAAGGRGAWAKGGPSAKEVAQKALGQSPSGGQLANLPPSASAASAALDVEADSPRRVGGGGRTMSFQQMLGQDLVTTTVQEDDAAGGEWVQVGKKQPPAAAAAVGAAVGARQPSALASPRRSPASRHAPGAGAGVVGGAAAPPAPAPLPGASGAAMAANRPQAAAVPASWLASALQRPASPLRPGSPSLGGLRRVDSGTLKDLLSAPTPGGRDVTALVAAREHWDEAEDQLRILCPAAEDLGLQPHNVVGVGLEELSTAQLDGVEAALHALLLRVGEMRVRRAVETERERAAAEAELREVIQRAGAGVGGR